MKKINIFLASSNELLADRERFEIEINRKNKLWQDKGVFLHLDIWEDLTARLSKEGLQAEYNIKVAQADVFVLLAYSKVGMYTAEEFDQAFAAFNANDKPFIFTYFKNIPDEEADESLEPFKNKLDALGHYYSSYQDSHDLWNQFNKELDRLLLDDFQYNHKNNETLGVDNKGATIKNQFVGGTFNNATFK